MQLSVNCELIDITTYTDNLWKNYEAGFKSWSISNTNIYVESDEGQQRLFEAMENGERVYIKHAPSRLFSDSNGQREVVLGVGYITRDSLTNVVNSSVLAGFDILGVGPFKKYKETDEQSNNCNFCCEEVHATLYLNHGDFFTPPPAPENSTKWVVEVNFQPTITGSGDIPEFYVQGVGSGLTGCPIQVTYRYLCENSAYIPSGGGPLTDFIDIGTYTQNPQQQEIIKLMERETGIKLLNSSLANLWIEFNNNFLFNNPDYVLDVSRFGLENLYIVSTFTNLKGIDCSFNHLTFIDLAALDNLNLEYINASHNLLGQNDTFIIAQVDTLKYLDLSYNYINESLLFDGAGIDLDFFDISYNTLAYLVNNGRKMKQFLMVRNTYPRDFDWGNFWESRVYDAGSPLMSGETFPQIMLDFSILEKLDLSESEFKDQELAISNIISKIMVDKGVSQDEAETIFLYSPTYTETEPRVPYNPTSLPRGGL